MPLKLPDISGVGIPKWLFNFVQALKAETIITKADLINYNLINSSDKRIDDSGDAIDES